MEKDQGVLTLVVKGDNKGARQRAREVEINVRPSVVWNITLLDYPLLLQLLMCELVRP
jgi:hypothetical protein